VEIHEVHLIKAMRIGYQSAGGVNFLWGLAHDGGESNMLLGNGNETVSVNMKLLYTISDLHAYLKTSANPEAVLSAAAYVALMNRTITTTLDAFLRVDRSSLSASLLRELSEFCEAEGLGIAVVQAIIESVHPPVTVANVYQQVVTASIDKNASVTRAGTEARRRLIEAARESKILVDNAKAEQHRRVSEAAREMAVYYAAMEAYAISPESFTLARYLKTYETVISGNRVYVFSPGAEGEMAKFVISDRNQVFFPVKR
jgi:regulator of protease activity HflC (stomatin/prohibitin superfamily)